MNTLSESEIYFLNDFLLIVMYYFEKQKYIADEP